MQLTKLFPLAVACLISLSTLAQENTSSPAQRNTAPAAAQGSLNSGTISSQFDYIFNSSNNYQEYKVVKRSSLEKLKTNVADSIKTLQQKLAETNNALGSHNENLNALQDSLSTAKSELERAKAEKESFSFFGVQMEKTSYNGMVWGLIALFFIVFLVFFFQFKKSNAITVETKKSYSELQEEFEKHRKRAMEREQKLNRQLQDELNKRL
ncbi:hypothetical protein [Olivibacter sitiensis]|uniref:hypothetical protein n=1 Tax=Olivibacter sitiensis TaxID=376470 RepID=UPI0004205774|nr:hypothetical protein [Olivibacter sitiensis]